MMQPLEEGSLNILMNYLFIYSLLILIGFNWSFQLAITSSQVIWEQDKHQVQY